MKVGYKGVYIIQTYCLDDYFHDLFLSLDRIPYHPPSLIGVAVDLLTL